MLIEDITKPGIGPAAAVLLTALLSGCGGTAASHEQAAAPARQALSEASMRSAALHPVERPVARPMDRGEPDAGTSQAVPPVERPVAKPMDRGLDEPGHGS